MLHGGAKLIVEKAEVVHGLNEYFYSQVRDGAFSPYAVVLDVHQRVDGRFEIELEGKPPSEKQKAMHDQKRINQARDELVARLELLLVRLGRMYIYLISHGRVRKSDRFVIVWRASVQSLKATLRCWKVPGDVEVFFDPKGCPTGGGHFKSGLVSIDC